MLEHIPLRTRAAAYACPHYVTEAGIFIEISGNPEAKKVPSDRTGSLLSRPLRTVRESFQLTQLKPSERLARRRGND